MIIGGKSAGQTGNIRQEEIKIDSVYITGNKVTKPQIILRELMFKAGQSYEKGDMDTILSESRDNVFNTQLFNFVTFTLDSLPACPGCYILHIDVIERWYIWPIPIFEIGDRNFNVWWSESRSIEHINYGINLDWQNFRGRKENLVMKLQFGYEEVISLEYRIPYLNKRKTLGIGFGAGYGRFHDVPYKTENNKQVYFDQDPGFARQDVTGKVQIYYRPDIFNTHLFELAYNRHLFSDSLVSTDPYYSLGRTRDEYFVFHYKYKSDHRDYQSYPLLGYYFDFEIFKNGFTGNSGPSFLSVSSTFRKYWQLADRFHYAFGINAKFSDDGRQPYYLLRGIGFGRDIVRGYEYYVANGQNFGILKNNLKFTLFRKEQSDLKVLRSDKFARTYFAFYINAYVDFGYADNRQFYGDHTNTLENELLIGYGVGLDFVTYYDIVIRFETSFNRMGEPGFYLHFRAPV